MNIINLKGGGGGRGVGNAYLPLTNTTNRIGTCPLVMKPDMIGFRGALVVCGFLVGQTRQRETNLSMADNHTARTFLQGSSLC